MRIRGVHLAGLAMALVGASAKDALAADLSVSTATTAPVTTSNASSGAGNVSITTTGSIAVTAGQTAVTIDSDNTLTNAGTISSNNADNSTGVSITGIRNSSGLTNSGAISLLEDYTLTDTDGDGDVDGAWTASETSNRTGIWLQSGANLHNDITNSGAITIEGGASNGIRLDGVLSANLVSSGTISVVGDNSHGVAINGGATGGVTGNVNVSGGITMRGENAVGLLVDAPIGGALNINGTWDVSGYHYTARPSTTTALAALDADDLRQSGPAIEVHYGVIHGITLQGIGVENDVDDDGDGVTTADGDLDDDATASINTEAAGPAIWIAPDAASPTPLVLGDTGRGYGFVNRGNITAQGIYDGANTIAPFTSVTGIRIEGAGGATTTLFGGLLNDGVITVLANEADAYGIYMGDGAIAPIIVTRKGVSVRSTSESDHSAYGIYLAAGSNVPAINNDGIVSAQLLGEVGNAAAITDASNKLATITNSGTIQAAIVATSSDGVSAPPPVQGEPIAIDLHNSTIDVTINQITSANNPLQDGTDDDTVDDDAAARPPQRITGDVLFGSGNDTLSLQTGTMVGNVSFGAGANTMTLDNGAQFAGHVTNGGTLNINVPNGFLGITGGTSNITTASFGAPSTFGVTLTNDSTSSFVHASVQVTFINGAKIVPVLPTGLPESGVITFLTADGGLVFKNTDNSAATASIVTGPVSSDVSPFVYDTSIGLVTGDPNSLAVTYTLKTAAELGFNANQTAAYDPVLAALRGDAAASTAFAGLHTHDDFFTAYNELLPNYAQGAAELAATAIQQGQSASSNRLATTRLNQINEVSVWAQEIGYGLTREPETFGLRYRGSGFGFATGIDGPLDNGAIFGLSTSFIASDVEEPQRSDGQISAYFGQLNAYLGTSMGPIDLDLVGGGGIGRERSQRFIDIGSVEAIAKAGWWAAEGHGIVRASAPMRAGNILITPAVQLSYVGLKEEGYGEEGAGSLGYKMDPTFSQRLWADATIELAGHYHVGGDTDVQPRISIGYRANAINDTAHRTVHFVDGGDPFTLTDEATGSGAPLIALGLDATNGYSTFSIGYEGEFGDEITRHSLNASLRFRF
ncbi:MAG: autotransporter outer membrane beta-barrel domain-containing protein [Alphaproteobacteria bacterium]